MVDFGLHLRLSSVRSLVRLFVKMLRLLRRLRTTMRLVEDLQDLDAERVRFQRVRSILGEARLEPSLPFGMRPAGGRREFSFAVNMLRVVLLYDNFKIMLR
jgi:hypothetical protein